MSLYEAANSWSHHHNLTFYYSTPIVGKMSCCVIECVQVCVRVIIHLGVRVHGCVCELVN